MKVITLLTSLKFFYAVLVILVLSLMWFYVRGLTSKGGISSKLNAVFYTWVGFLSVLAISFHILTAWQIPWVHWEVNRSKIIPDREIRLEAKEHKFMLPANPIRIREGDVIKFRVFSKDLPYGFGVFSSNGAMEFQMQVIPGHANEIIWVFQEKGLYSIRSTEYAGIETDKMYLKNAIEISPARREIR